MAFEADMFGDFQDLVMELRGIEAAGIAARDTPTFTCLEHFLREGLASLG